MPQRPGTAARSAPYTALLLALAVLLSTLLPTGAAWAADDGAPGTAPSAAEECATLPLAPLGDPGDAVGTATVPAQGTSCFTFTAGQTGLHRVLVRGGDVHAEVLDGETRVDCHDVTWGAGWCELPRTGAFTLKVTNRSWSEPAKTSAVVVPLATTAGCAPEVGTSWADPVVRDSASGPLSVQCRPFAGKPGERIVVESRTTAYGTSVAWITDESGAHICPRFNEDDSKGCVLPGDGPYRVLSEVRDVENDRYPAEYTLKIRRLSDPAGCASVPANAYGSAPTVAAPATGCKIFTAPAAGRYDVFGVQHDERSSLAVYDRAGRTVCEQWQQPCSVPAAGDYTLTTDAATLVLDRASTAGCAPAELGLHEGTFTAAGEIDCLTLPLPENARLAVLEALNGPSPRPDVSVVDADGVQRCTYHTLSEGTCELTGKAPHRALVSTDDSDPATGTYRIALHRTDAVNGCPAVPAGDFTATSPTARFTTGDGVFSHCLSIPADDHSAMENLQLQTVSGTSTAKFSVLDATGKQVCSVRSSLSTWTTCALTPGAAHTVLVTGRDTPASYTLTRRDVTAGAKGCAANPATAVGGPSSGGTLGAPGTLVCRQVTTGDAADALHLDVRDANGTANILAYDAKGEAACSYRNRACAVTGSTSYQVLVTVPTNLKAAPSYRFDALRFATAAGPAPECTKVPNVSYGYGPVTGSLTEQRTAWCAALPTAADDRFDLRISDTAGGAQTAVPALYDKTLDNGCYMWIGEGGSAYECYLTEPHSSEPSPSTLVVGLPEKAPATSYSVQLVCKSSLCGPDEKTVGAVTPATAAAGGKATVTVTGTALHKDDKVRLSGSGRTVESTTTSVAPDRKSLTAVLDLTGVPAGGYHLSVVTTNGRQYSKGTFTVTQPALANTSAPAITGTAQVGARLTAGTGSWTVAPDAYTYQWKADGQAVAGATAAAYTVPATLLGRKLTVTVTAARAGSSPVAATSAAVTVAKGAAPKATVAPRISGSVRTGVKVTAVAGTWSPAATSYAYQWRANGAMITGATAGTYTVPTSLLGKKLTVTVTARRTGHGDGAVTSAAIVVAQGVPPKATKAPAITGTAKVGRTLTANRGTWTPAPTSYGYQWYANGVAITGATKSTLVLKSAQKGKKITVRVNAFRTGHPSGSALSRATATVAG
ncbi:hypothetical protein [Streptomyces wuyuanensis]|uniref:hypothetical protein n=1 Tax=Streptomyces wuyuanensis TaxID=1196353 RepID=UPI003787C1A7